MHFGLLTSSWRQFLFVLAADTYRISYRLHRQFQDSRARQPDVLAGARKRYGGLRRDITTAQPDSHQSRIRDSWRRLLRLPHCTPDHARRAVAWMAESLRSAHAAGRHELCDRNWLPARASYHSVLVSRSPTESIHDRLRSRGVGVRAGAPTGGARGACVAAATDDDRALDARSRPGRPPDAPGGLLCGVARCVGRRCRRGRTGRWSLCGRPRRAHLGTRELTLLYGDGFLVRRHRCAGTQERLFGAFSILFYGYNAASALLTVLASEPRGGIFELVGRIWQEGPGPAPWQWINVITSLATSAFVVWAVPRLPSRRRREIAVACAGIIGNACLGFLYARDRIPSLAGVLYALCVYVCSYNTVTVRIASGRSILVRSYGCAIGAGPRNGVDAAVRGDTVCSSRCGVAGPRKNWAARTITVSAIRARTTRWRKQSYSSR